MRDRRQLVLPGEVALRSEGAEMPLVLVSAEGHHGFRATVVPQTPDGAPIVSQQSREALGVAAGDRVMVRVATFDAATLAATLDFVPLEQLPEGDGDDDADASA